jgi:hypothetical protein
MNNEQLFYPEKEDFVFVLKIYFLILIINNFFTSKNLFLFFIYYLALLNLF